MLRKSNWILGIGCALVINSVNATVMLTFEGAGDNTQILNFYNGGTDGQGHAGQNLGVSFSSDAFTFIDSDAGGTATIANEPSPSTILGFQGTGLTMNVTAGFSEGFSVFYTSRVTGVVTIFDGLDAIGNTLASANLGINHNLGGCTGDPNPNTGEVCHWDLIALNFGGLAKSVRFDASSQFATAFDNITIGSVAAVPEPNSLSLALLGLSLIPMVAVYRRKAVRRNSGTPRITPNG